MANAWFVAAYFDGGALMFTGAYTSRAGAGSALGQVKRRELRLRWRSEQKCAGEIYELDTVTGAMALVKREEFGGEV